MARSGRAAIGTSFGEGSRRWSATVAAATAACIGVVGSRVSAVSRSPVVREIEFFVVGSAWLWLWPSSEVSAAWAAAGGSTCGSASAAFARLAATATSCCFFTRSAPSRANWPYDGTITVRPDHGSHRDGHRPGQPPPGLGRARVSPLVLAHARPPPGRQGQRSNAF